MGKLCSCFKFGNRRRERVEPGAEAVELKPTCEQPSKRAVNAEPEPQIGQPIDLEIRRSAQEAYKTYLKSLSKDVRWRLDNCDCPKEDISQFEIRGCLGKGSFGIVVVAKYSKDGQDYAVKIQRKEAVERNFRIRDVIREKYLQYAASGIFVVEVKFTWQDATNLYMMLEYSAYGDFARCVLCNENWEATEENVKVYAAQIVLGLEFLHSNDIILRDLKPENCIVFPDGYLKLSDFGLAKASKGNTYTSCGTLSYMAPELVLNKGHRTAVDWWAFGVMIFEMLHGRLPFYVSRKEELTKSNIISGTYEFDPSLDLSSNVRCLVEQLLQVSPAMRLGNLADKADDVKLHPWFSDINFDHVLKRKYKIDFECEPLVPEKVDDMTVYGEQRLDDPHALAFESF